MKLIIFGVTFFLANFVCIFATQPCDLGTKEKIQLTTEDCLVEAPMVGSEMFFVLGVSRQEVGNKFQEWLDQRNQQDFSCKPGFFYFNEICEFSRRLGFKEERPEEEQINNDIRRYLEHCRILHPYGEFQGTENIIGFIAYAFGITVQIWEKKSTITNIRRYNPSLSDASEKTVNILVEQGKVSHFVLENSSAFETRRAQYLRGISRLSVDLLGDRKFLWRIQKHYFPEFQAHLSWLDTYAFFERSFGWKRSDLGAGRGVKLSDEQHAIEKFKTEFLPYFEWWGDQKDFIEKAIKYYQLQEDVVKQLIPSKEVGETA